MSSYPFRKIYLVIALTLIASIVFAFDLHAAQNKKVNTVTTEDVYTEQIAKTEPLSYDELRQIFEKNPTYSMSCVPATTLFRPKSELQETFKEQIPSPQMQLFFGIQEQGDGFDLYMSRDNSGYSQDSALSCERGKEYRCSSVKLIQEKTVKIQKPGFAPEAVVLETFQFYPRTNGSMYAKYEFSITAMEFNMWNRPTYKVSLDLSYICKVSFVPSTESQKIQQN